MTSEIRVNKLQNRVGLGTVEYTNTGIVVSGIVTCTELSGLTALNIAGVGTANTLDINGDIDVDGHTELDNTNIVGLVTVTNVSSGIGLKLIDSSSKQFFAGGGGGGTPFAGSFTGHDFRIQVGGLQNAIFKYAAGATGNLELGPSSGIGITFNGSTGNAGYAGIVTATSFVGDGSALTNLPAATPDKIEEGNSKIEVVDTGTGSLSFVLDGSEKLNMGSYAQFNQTVFVNDTLQVGGQLQVSDAIPHMNNTGTRIRFPTNDVISFNTNNAERLRITSGGTALFGTTASVNSLRAVFQGYSDGGENFQARIRFQSNQATNLTSGSHIANLLFTNSSGSEGARIDVKADSNWGTGSYPSRIEFSTTASSANTPTERLRITSDGNIGAGGITSPLWTSGGGIHLNDNYGIGFGNGGSGRPDFQLMVTDGSKLEFRCGYGADTADIVMDTSGRLLIGTTTNSISSSELLEVKSNATGFSHFRNNSSSYAPIYIDNEYSDTGFAPLLTFTDGGGNRGGIGQDNTDLLRITGQGGVSIYTAGTHGGGTEKFQVTQAGQINLGSSGTLKAIINESSISGHYFVSQCSDNNNGFEIYQQHGSTATRNTLAVYDNRRGSKIESLLIRGDGVKVTRSRGGNYARTYEFNYNTGAPGGVQTVSLATVINYGGTTSAVADVTYVGVYGTANDYIYSGHWICGVRRANNDGAWNQTAAEVAGNGSSSTSSIDVYWSSGQLYAQTVGPWMGWTVNVRITILNGEITVNV